MKKHILLLGAVLINLVSTAQTKSIIYFDSNKSDLNTTSIQSLDSLVGFLKDKNGYQLSINGYCDNTGNDVLNQKLSERRAETVSNYFKNINSGIPSFKGFSSSSPVATNADEHGKSQNRRVEILLTLKKPEQPAPEKKIEPVVTEPVFNATPSTLDANSTAKELEVGSILILKNLNFEGGTATLLKESEPSLKMLLKLLKENPTMEVEIEGHVCCANDMGLSVDRALTVLEYLVGNGINEKRLKYAGHSWNNPIASDATEIGRKTNRRVEIMILKK